MPKVIEHNESFKGKVHSNKCLHKEFGDMSDLTAQQKKKKKERKTHPGVVEAM